MRVPARTLVSASLFACAIIAADDVAERCAVELDRRDFTTAVRQPTLRMGARQDILASQRQLADAEREYLAAIAKRPNTPAILNAVSELKRDQEFLKLPDEAAKLFRNAPDIDSSSAAAKLAFGEALVALGQAGQPGELLEPAAPAGLNLQRLQFLLGRGHKASGRDADANRAFACFRELAREEQQSDAAQLNGAVCPQSPVRKTVQGLETLVQRGASDVVVQARLDRVRIYERQGKRLEVAHHLEERRELAPNDPEYRYQLEIIDGNTSCAALVRMRASAGCSARVKQLEAEQYALVASQIRRSLAP